MNFNLKLLFDRLSSQGRKVMEILRDAYGDETLGRKNPKIIVENKHEVKEFEEDNGFDNIPNNFIMEDNHDSYMRNSVGSYGRVLRVEMM